MFWYKYCGSVLEINACIAILGSICYCGFLWALLRLLKVNEGQFCLQFKKIMAQIILGTLKKKRKNENELMRCDLKENSSLS